MHEASLARELLRLIEQAAQAHSARKVGAARVELGALSCVSADALTFAFEALRRGTLAESCHLLIERSPLRIACPACGAEGATDAQAPACPECGQIPLEVLSGREMRLVSIDVEDDEPDA
jgi:hydrogenase nickel incorporation protein HypA/HybF